MDYLKFLINVDKELSEEFIDRKLYTRYLCDAYHRCSSCGFDTAKINYFDRYSSVSFCSKFLDFGLTVTGEHKLCKANFCRDKFCPMCAWRRTRKMYNQVYTCVDSIYSDYQFLFLTLTVPNVDGSELSDTIDLLNKSFQAFIRYKIFKNVVVGYVKCLEITYNRKRDDYHPHFHVLLVVPSDYFSSDNYVSRDSFLSAWRRATNNYSITQVDIRRIRCNPNRPDLNNISSAVAEVTKYAIKPTDYIFTDSKILTDRILYTLSNVLYGRRTISFGGIFFKLRKRLGYTKDINDDDDLIHIDNKASDDIVSVSRYVWYNGRYHLYAVQTPDDSPNQYVVPCSDSDFAVDLDTGEILI